MPAAANASARTWQSRIAALRPPLECLPELVPPVTHLGLGVLQTGIEVGPLEVRVNESEHGGQIATGIRLIRRPNQFHVVVGHRVLLYIALVGVGGRSPAMRGGARGAPGRRSARCGRTTATEYRPTWPAGSTPGRGARGGQTQPNGRIRHQYRTPHVIGQGQPSAERP